MWDVNCIVFHFGMFGKVINFVVYHYYYCWWKFRSYGHCLDGWTAWTVYMLSSMQCNCHQWLMEIYCDQTRYFSLKNCSFSNCTLFDFSWVPRSDPMRRKWQIITKNRLIKCKEEKRAKIKNTKKNWAVIQFEVWSFHVNGKKINHSGMQLQVSKQL